jgi:ABC-type oligopeptide transport system substrate-binding subunit
MPELVGTVLNDRYRLELELGRGGMGVVYRAHDTLLDRRVAVKVLSETVLDHGGRARLLREAQAAAGLNHPNIVSVHDVGEADGLPFVVMELVEGGSLHGHSSQDLDQILSIARQVGAALDHAHTNGIIHRDLKPENVLLSPGGTAKLSDFGLARTLASRLTGEGLIVGTAFYLAPEQALGQEIDGRADLYSLGVLLYELATGQMPFVGDDPLTVISQHLHAPVVPPRARNADIPPILDALITSLLSKDPGERPGSAAEVVRILKAPDILDREAMPLRELSVLERIERGRMVGRDRDLQQARTLWTNAASGQGQMLLVSGEPGIGKTRLVQTLMTQVQISGGRALLGACYAEGGVPYDPFAQILRGALEEDVGEGLKLPPTVLAGLLNLAPSLQLRYPEVTPAPPLDDLQSERHRLFRDIVIFATALAEQAPLLVVLEDVHWADSSTLSLLRHLARCLKRQRVLLVATYREVELDETRPLQEVLLDLQRERLATRLKLLRLDREQTGELLGVLFAAEITPEFLGGVYRETEGNPFFIEEVCKALVESGKLYYEDGRWHRPSMDELGIPQNVSVAIQSRVRVLPNTVQQTLRLAAVLGRTFDLDTLVAASELDEAVLLDGLADAQHAQLIEEVSGGRSVRERGVFRHDVAPPDMPGRTFTFVHGLIPSTLVESLTPTERRGMHHQAAGAIESQSRAEVELMAYHYDRAGDAAKAAHYLLQAGDRARSLYACEEAIDCYQRALVLLKEQGEYERAARTLMRMGLVYTAAFEPDKAREAYDEAFDLWEPLREAEDLPSPRAPTRVLRFALEEPLSLDPARIFDDVSRFMVAQLFEGLVTMDPVYNVLPAVAARWKVADGGRRYTFRLRGDLCWSDGRPLTAVDFEYAWRRNLRLDPPAPLAHLLYVIKNARAYGERQIDDAERVGVRALDDLTLEVCLEEPTAYLPQLLAHAVALPQPRWAVEGEEGCWTDPDRIVGNGPYQLVELRPGESLVLGRNPCYQGQFPGNAERVECAIMADYGQALDSYAAGTLDAVSLINADAGAIARARVAHGRELVFTPQPSTYYLAFRTDVAPFDDVRVRQALVHAVDRDALVSEASEGQYLPAEGGFVPPGMPAHSADIGLAYDVGRARDLLKEAGYQGGQGFPDVSWLYSGGSAGEPIVPFVQRAWRRNLGLELQAQSMEWGEFQERRMRDPPHLSLAGWLADYPDPDDFLRTTYHSTEGINAARCGWHNAHFDALVEEAARVADPARRVALYQEADRILVSEEAAMMPLCYAQGRILIKPRLTMPRVPPAMLQLKEILLEREEC